MARGDETIGTAELAEALDVHRNTVINWIKDARLRPDIVTLGGHARFKRSSIRAIKKRLRDGARAAA